MHESLDRPHLDLLVAVRHTGHLGRAATQLAISPSAASHRLKEAERRLGVTLTVAEGRSLRLTDAALHLADVAEVATASMRSAEETARWMNSTDRATVRIALDFYDTAPWFERLVESDDLTVDVDFVRTPYFATVDFVERRRVDLGLIVVPIDDPVRDPLADDHKLLVARELGARLGPLLDDLVLATAGQLLDDHGGPVRTEGAWRSLRDDVRRELGDRARAPLDEAVALARRGDAIRARMAELAPTAPSPALGDVGRQLDRLVGDGFVTRAGLARLDDLDRYLAALELRLDRVRGDVERDLDLMRSVQALELRLHDLADRFGEIRHEPLADITWQLEELRVSLWAQRLGTAGKVSVPRIERALDEVVASIA